MKKKINVDLIKLQHASGDESECKKNAINLREEFKQKKIIYFNIEATGMRIDRKENYEKIKIKFFFVNNFC